MFKTIHCVVKGIDHGWDGVTATTPKWFVVWCRDILKAQLEGPPHLTTNHGGVVAITPSQQIWIKCIYNKIHSKPPPNRVTSPTCLHCDVMHLSLMTGVVALHIPLWRLGEREEHSQALNTVWPLNAGKVICGYQSNLNGIINHYKHIWHCIF